jgi:hypothetical protein
VSGSRKVIFFQVTSSLPETFLQNVLDVTGIQPKTLKFYSTRLNKLLKTLEITEVRIVSRDIGNGIKKKLG